MTDSNRALAAYRDAVENALDRMQIGVRERSVNEQGPSIGLDLDPISDVRQPTMLWTPDHGWRIAVACRGEVRPATIRYLARGFAPYPVEVAAQVALWMETPDAVSDEQPVYPPHARATVLAELARATGLHRQAAALSHVLINGTGCPSFCRTDHEHADANPFTQTIRHNGKAMRVGGVDVFPTIHVDTREGQPVSLATVPPTGPRMRVVIDGEADETPPNIIYFGLRNAERMAKLLGLAGDTSGLAEAIRVAVAALDAESRNAANIAAERHEQTEAAR